MTMTSEAKRALSTTIRNLRQRLLGDLRDATESTYRLSVRARDAGLDEASHVLAAAIRTSADVILTFNIKDFPAESLAPYGIETGLPHGRPTLCRSWPRPSPAHANPSKAQRPRRRSLPP